MNSNILYLVVPCYNEEEILPSTASTLEKKINNLVKKGKISEKSKIMFVDDGSTDNTWQIIKNLHEKNEIFTGISLSKNSGHQNALLAGLMTAKKQADFTISLDVDLQDDVDSIDEMVEKYLSGFDIVYGVRINRQTDSFFKKTTATIFYKIMNILGAKTIENHADFRLMNKKALNALEKFKEVNIFLRGIVPMIGYRTTEVFYKRKERKLGTSKYPFNKMVHFAFDGITSCSTKIFSIITTTGLLMIVIAFLILLNKFLFFKENFPIEFIILTFSLWLVGGIITISLALLGNYIGKIYLETKKRPRYIIENDLENTTKP